MDSLIVALEKVTVNESFDNQLDNLINSFEVNLDIDCDQEWEELSKNYSRLLYIHKFIKKHEQTNPNLCPAQSKFPIC